MKLRHVIVLAFTALTIGTTGLARIGAQQSAALRQDAVPRLEHTTFTLTNGLKVILSQDKRLPMVAVNLWYHVGPANETRAAPASRTCSST